MNSFKNEILVLVQKILIKTRVEFKLNLVVKNENLVVAMDGCHGQHLKGLFFVWHGYLCLDQCLVTKNFKL